MISRGSLSIRRSAFAILPACAGFVWLGGCTNSESDERAQVQDQLADVQIRLASATAGTIRPGAEGYDAAVQELEGVVSSIRGINGGSRGQQGARELLAATALQDLASMEQQAIDVAMEDIAQLRAEVAANAKAALMLNGLADARASVDVSDERARLDDTGAAVQRDLTAANQQASELGDPIAEREQQNDADRAQVASLRDRAEELYRQADVKGPSEGLDDYLEGQRLNREADQLERRISERMIDLDYDYAAEHARINDHIASLRAQLETLGTTRSDLDSLMQSFNADASASRAKSGEMAGKAQSALAAIEGKMANEIAPLYESAVQHLTDAASQAQSAAGKLDRDSANAARMARVRVLAALGQVHTLHADALDQQASVMALLGSHPDMQSVASKVSAVNDQRDQARQNAVQAYSEAKAAVGGSTNAETLAMQNNLDAVIAKLTGAAAPAPMSITPPDGGTPTRGAITPPSAAPNAGSGAGLASPAEFVTIMNSTDVGALDENDRFLAACTASTPSGLATHQLFQSNAAFERAMVEKFGVEATQTAFTAATGSSGGVFVDSRIDSEDDSSAVVSFTMEGLPGRINVDLANTNGSWYLNLDSFAAALEAMPGGALIMQVLGLQSEAFAAIAPRVAAGEFADANEAATALMQEVQSRMSGLAPG